MKNYHKFKLVLTVLSPVHVGNGEEYKNFEYFLDETNDVLTFTFPNMNRIFDEINKHNLVEDFINPNNIFNLKSLLIEKLPSIFESSSPKKQVSNHSSAYAKLQKKMSNSEVKKTLREEFGYSLSVQKDLLQSAPYISGDLNKITIKKFEKDLYTGKPYISGSSLKGALRTILMNTYWKDKANIYKNTNKNSENKSAIPWGATDKRYDDIFNEIHVLDSEPIDVKQLTVARKFDLYFNDNAGEEQIKEMSVYRESLKRGTKVVFYIETTTPRAFDLINNLKSYAKDYFKEYCSNYLDTIPNRENIFYHNPILSDTEPLYLGAGTGAWTKIAFVTKGVPETTVSKKHTNIKCKLTRLPSKKGTIYAEMGKCCFTIEELT